MAYIDWKEDEYSYSSNTSSNEEVSCLCLTMRHKRRDLEVSDSHTHCLSFYNELSEVNKEMYVKALQLKVAL